MKKHLGFIATYGPYATETTMTLTIRPDLDEPWPKQQEHISLKRTGKYAKYHNKPNYKRH